MMRTSIDVIVIAEDGNCADRYELNPMRIQTTLESSGYRVRSVTLLDSSTGLTGSLRDDRTVREDRAAEGN